MCGVQTLELPNMVCTYSQDMICGLFPYFRDQATDWKMQVEPGLAREKIKRLLVRLIAK
jgi:hypothetical protein